MRNLICCAVFFVIQTLQLTFASTLSNEEKLAARVDQIFEHFNASTPGAAVAVVKDGKLLLAKGYGMANLEYDIPITEHTVFHVASVSKQFTAFSVYLLASQGKLKLTDNVREYIPELPNFGIAIP
jgi:CubicO group peptidase (beta-lactamase class C family)